MSHFTDEEDVLMAEQVGARRVKARKVKGFASLRTVKKRRPKYTPSRLPRYTSLSALARKHDKDMKALAKRLGIIEEDLDYLFESPEGE
ncbi:hypothetical protein LCGC14_2657390 [marine sediment metagenome]|uniref:Uncharacterized protein n=1 Tax=marine sediment metagenome TaxID=412755 RepID=A0A0F9CK20_9ZZZZ